MKAWTFKLKNAGNGFMIREPDPEVEYLNIADVFMTNDPKIAEKRARLMAAAPELYDAARDVDAALQRLLESGMLPPKDVDMALSVAWGNLRKAIGKATEKR